MVTKRNKRPDLASMDTMEAAAERLRAVAHPARLRMLDTLLQGEYAVHEIASFCGLSPSQTCEHLRFLQGRQILSSRRRGRTVYYRIAAPQIPGLLACIKKHCGAQSDPGRRTMKGNSR
ncbi:MAG: winged helix-turn-helix transcriptional regulator [Phycisphaerae bacterium]|nr:winged helix-turn-helix transcriptional regulator [Phycisphaerae bacterium]